MSTTTHLPTIDNKPIQPFILGAPQAELKKICEEQDRAREEIQRRIGVVKIVDDFVREAREGQ